MFIKLTLARHENALFKKPHEKCRSEMPEKLTIQKPILTVEKTSV